MAITALEIPGIKTIIGRDGKGTPIWPDGVCGSISHSGDGVVVAVAKATDYLSIGIDLQKITHLKQDITKHIAVEDELDWIRISRTDSELRTLMLFSAKECFYKAFFPLAHRHLGFKEVRARYSEKEKGFYMSIIDKQDESLCLFSKETLVNVTISDGFILSTLSIVESKN